MLWVKVGPARQPVVGGVESTYVAYLVQPSGDIAREGGEGEQRAARGRHKRRTRMAGIVVVFPDFVIVSSKILRQRV